MNKLLIDSSVWIEYFRNRDSLSILDELIETNQICTNDLILSELIPYLQIKGNFEVIEALRSIEKVEIKIDWQIIIGMQITNIKNGINKAGIPDLIILQNVTENNLILFSLDKHFKLMNKLFEYRLYGYNETKT